MAAAGFPHAFSPQFGPSQAEETARIYSLEGYLNEFFDQVVTIRLAALHPTYVPAHLHDYCRLLGGRAGHLGSTLQLATRSICNGWWPPTAPLTRAFPDWPPSYVDYLDMVLLWVNDWEDNHARLVHSITDPGAIFHPSYLAQDGPAGLTGILDQQTELIYQYPQQPEAAHQHHNHVYQPKNLAHQHPQQPEAVYQQPAAIYQQQDLVYQQLNLVHQQLGALHQHPNPVYQSTQWTETDQGYPPTDVTDIASPPSMRCSGARHTEQRKEEIDSSSPADGSDTASPPSSLSPTAKNGSRSTASPPSDKQARDLHLPSLEEVTQWFVHNHNDQPADLEDLYRQYLDHQIQITWEALNDPALPPASANSSPRAIYEESLIAELGKILGAEMGQILDAGTEDTGPGSGLGSRPGSGSGSGSSSGSGGFESFKHAMCTNIYSFKGAWSRNMY